MKNKCLALMLWLMLFALSTHSLYAKTIKSVTEQSTPTSNNNFAVGYLSFWNMTPSEIENIHTLYSHVIVSFAKPNATYAGKWAKKDTTGIQIANDSNPIHYKKAIKKLQDRGVKVLLSVGGGEYSQGIHLNNWSKLTAEYGKDINHTTHKKAIRDIVRDLGLDGIDIDYEKVVTLDITDTLLNEYTQVILTIKEIVDNLGSDKLLGIAVGAVGAECSKEMVNNKILECTQKSPLGYRVGLERKVFANLINKGKKLETIFDFISIMSYDYIRNNNGTFIYDPIIAHEHYKEIYKGLLAIGFQTTGESGDGVLVATNTEAKTCKETSMLHPYFRKGDWLPKTKPYSLERFIRYIRETPNSGIMVWNLSQKEAKKRDRSKCKHAIDINLLNTYTDSFDLMQK
jgi:GH18 family chitinase